MLRSQTEHAIALNLQSVHIKTQRPVCHSLASGARLFVPTIQQLVHQANSCNVNPQCKDTI